MFLHSLKIKMRWHPFESPWSRLGRRSPRLPKPSWKTEWSLGSEQEIVIPLFGGGFSRFFGTFRPMYLCSFLHKTNRFEENPGWTGSSEQWTKRSKQVCTIWPTLSGDDGSAGTGPSQEAESDIDIVFGTGELKGPLHVDTYRVGVCWLGFYGVNWAMTKLPPKKTSEIFKGFQEISGRSLGQFGMLQVAWWPFSIQVPWPWSISPSRWSERWQVRIFWMLTFDVFVVVTQSKKLFVPTFWAVQAMSSRPFPLKGSWAWPFPRCRLEASNPSLSILAGCVSFQVIHSHYNFWDEPLRWSLFPGKHMGE